MLVFVTIDVKCERRAIHGRLALIENGCARYITDSIDVRSLFKYSVNRCRWLTHSVRRSHTLFRKRIYLFRLKLNMRKFPYRFIEWSIKIGPTNFIFQSGIQCSSIIDLITKTNICPYDYYYIVHNSWSDNMIFPSSFLHEISFSTWSLMWCWLVVTHFQTMLIWCDAGCLSHIHFDGLTQSTAGSVRIAAWNWSVCSIWK